jgi:hypothetical protein
VKKPKNSFMNLIKEFGEKSMMLVFDDGIGKSVVKNEANVALKRKFVGEE